jgi:hypothetical protein
MNGIIHPYYMVALAPGIAALVGIGATSLWQARRLGVAGRAVAAFALTASGWWGYVLLDRTPQWLPWLRWVVLLAAVAAAGCVLAGPALARVAGAWAAAAAGTARSRRIVLGLVPGATLAFALIAGLAGPTAYALDTVNSSHSGAIPAAGPSGSGSGGVGGFGGLGGGVGRGTGGLGGNGFPGQAGRTGTGTAGTGTGGFGNGGPTRAGTSTGGTGAGGKAGAGGVPGGTGTRGGFGAGGGMGGASGLGGDTQVSSAIAQLLEKDASSYTWVAATEGSQAAAPLELATGDAVMAIGGFNGTDPWPTLAVFEELVAQHKIHYYVGQSGQSFGGGQGSSAISTWVAAHFKKLTVGGQTVYDLTQPSSGSS